MIKLHRSRSEMKPPDLTAMIDVVFLLLIFFLLTSMVVNPILPIDLPDSSSSRMDDRDAVSISLDRSGTIMLNDREVDEASLKQVLEDLLRKKKEKKVELRADSRLFFGRVVKIMDHVKQAGASSIAVVTEKTPDP